MAYNMKKLEIFNHKGRTYNNSQTQIIPKMFKEQSKISHINMDHFHKNIQNPIFHILPDIKICFENYKEKLFIEANLSHYALSINRRTSVWGYELSGGYGLICNLI